jgi:hypothetical protein
VPDNNRFGTESWPVAESLTGGRRDVKLLDTVPNDTNIWLAVGAEDPNDGVAVGLEPGQARSVAYGLLRRANLIDPAPQPKTREVPATPTAIITEFLRQTREVSKRILDVDPEHQHLIRHLCDEFAVIALMAELEQIAPERAAKIAARLADAWEDGGSIDEFLFEWREAHAAGRPVGFNPPPVLPLDVRRVTT